VLAYLCESDHVELLRRERLEELELGRHDGGSRAGDVAERRVEKAMRQRRWVNPVNIGNYSFMLGMQAGKSVCVWGGLGYRA
jgi:hypothetical protein